MGIDSFVVHTLGLEKDYLKRPFKVLECNTLIRGQCKLSNSHFECKKNQRKIILNGKNSQTLFWTNREKKIFLKLAF